MGIIDRVSLYKRLEVLRGNPLIVYVTSQRPGAPGQMGGDVIDEFMSQLEAYDGDADTIDLLLESTGGDGLTAWRIISLLRTRFKKVNVLLPHSAFSAATILALGANEIVMCCYASLGPIDPQITVVDKTGAKKQFAYEDILAFIDFTKKEFGLSEQDHFESAFTRLCETVEPSALGFASRASSLAVAIGERLLQMHMVDPDQKSQASIIAKKLNKSFFSHGHALSKKEAKDIGLNIVEPDKEVEKIMWQIHTSFETEFETRKPFDSLGEFFSDPDAAPYLASPPPIHIPPGMSQDIALQLMQQYLINQISYKTPDVIRTVKFVALESVRSASENRARLKIIVTRNLDMSFGVNTVVLEQGWFPVSLEVEE